ncbi:MAG: alginate export family protein [Rhodospirillales bacterium]|nr:alginate export family protein [Rhodospirillales bacterium]USO08434.1 MAG: alginate export family protein [Rhodospirillales bacterium]
MKNKILLLTAAFLAIPSTLHAEDAKTGITPFGQVRLRYENVDQDGLTKDADALTARINAGLKTDKIHDFQGLVELQAIQHLSQDNFNDGVNGKATYPTVSDPQNAEINQLWLAWSGLPGVEAKVGRQAVNWDNQRFVGSVDWRQNDQTLDSALLSYTGIEKLTLQYGYLWNINRITGGDHTLGDIESNSHIARASYALAPWLTATAYGLSLDFDNWATKSSRTYGLRLTGDVPVTEGWTGFYELEAAKQNDAHNNTANYSEGYFLVSPGIKGYGLNIQPGYEKLGGNGTSSFQTPLATLHKFNGWADKFLDTPANGLEDTFINVSYTLPESVAPLNGIVLSAAWHDYNADRTSTDYGTEADFSVKKSFKGPDYTKGIDVILKYADYNADGLYTDTQKAWAQVDVKF